eukprot:TRINITY_DN16305_c0_g1_i1.p1 TRINITY_DN16305_c0_g1~~TRINITY_DN16305_c0_g1_i1.p1  ORF type:complete len:1562 (+),score=274.84 TRINITY_DN16305_c0_g1_i1:79-4764(+)
MSSTAWIAPPPATVAAVDEFAEWEAASAHPAELRLKSGESWKGWSFGAKASVAGEVVFSTNMVGYPESLTDPSFAGQILVMTYPLIGNYGVPDETLDETGLLANFEGDKIYPVAVVIAEYSFTASHYAAKKTLAKWLEEHNVPAIFGVDTRAITKTLRERGSCLGAVAFCSPGNMTPMWVDPNERNLVADVSVKQVKTFEPSSGTSPKTPLIVAVDCGMKYNIIRFFLRHLQVKLKVVPWDYDFTEEDFDGLFISNGPGDPMKCTKTIDHLQKCMKTRPNLPIFGICLGHQLLSIAAGAKTYKMKFGNRGVNQPCVDMRTGRCYITSQNHGFAVDDTNLPDGWRALFTNANDGSNEGIAHANRPWQSVQFHPEASGGPLDTYFLFDEFLRIVTNSQSRFMTTIQYKHPRQISKVLVLGSGGLTIGQAGEFDYSGAQAIKALREQHVQSVLINPNIATVQTSKGLADQIYLLPVTPEFVTKVIEKVRPDGLFAAFGGQTALNCAIQLHKDGTLKKYGVQVLGTQIDAIVATEDRKLFKEGVESIGEKVAESGTADSVEGARAIAARIGYPVLVRAAFALGGLGSGFAQNEAELESLCAKAFINSPQVIIDECLRGWKELEYEVMRDFQDNTLVVCNMENIDPMGIHTGDSIVVAPSQTLTNDEYNKLRDTAIKVIRHFGIVGEANIQYALDPYSNKYRIVEVNPRLSRSSALASKATGYPLAYIAAKIALGHDLVSLRNQVTRCTTACFEPSLDYCVVKIPRWDLDKFPTVDKTLGPQMKSVGEVMSIGRCFSEATQKAMRMVNESSVGFDESFYLRTKSSERTLEQDLGEPGPTRMWAVAHAFDSGKTIDDVHAITMIDRWFLSKLFCISQMRKKFSSLGGLKELDEGKSALLRRAKQYGFSDKQIALALGNCTAMDVFGLREQWNIRPHVKLVDTLAAEFPAQTNYLYLTYAGSEHDVDPLRLAVLPAYKDSLYDTAFGKGHLEDEHGMPMKKTSAKAANAGALQNKLMDAAMKTVRAASLRPGEERSSFIVLGSGCYRIGASVEFDWGCVNAVRTLRETGHRAMVINCNPETVSTDYDESDRLYFEELSLETVLEICNFEDPTGVIVSVGGQTPNNLAPDLHKNGVPLLGTSASSIDMAEDRSKFSALCDALGVDQPEWSEFTKFEDALAFAGAVSFPVLVRPSYVLSGAAMRVIDDETELRSFLSGQAVVEQEHPVVISKYHSGAREIEFDAVARNGKLVNYAISEHVEDAGTHSGDATLLLPAQTLSLETHRHVMQIAKQLCRALSISGPFNVQFLAKEGSSSSMREVKVIECNLRASRTVPFVSKTFDVNFIELATRVMLGQEVKSVPVHLLDFEFVACKVAMFSFLRLSGADPHYGVEMQSTGEIACFGKDSQEAFLKAMLAAGHKLPRGPTGLLLALGPQADKLCFIPFLMLLAEMGYTFYGTKGTAAFFNDQNMTCASKPVTVTPLETAAAQTDAIDQKLVKIVITTPSSRDSGGATAGYFLRRKALDSGMALVVDIRLAMKLVDALYQKYVCEKNGTEFWTIESWHETQRVG